MSCAIPFDAGFDVVTTTTHKTLRGPRGGLILCQRGSTAAKIDAAVFPGLQGGPHMNNVAGAAITFKKAAEPAFAEYARATLRNAKALAAALMARASRSSPAAPTTTCMVIDTMASFGLDGRAAEDALDAIGITTNKQVIPDDPRPPLRPSGVRLGTPACTTRGMDEDDMARLARWIVRTLRRPEDAKEIAATRAEVMRCAVSIPCRDCAHDRKDRLPRDYWAMISPTPPLSRGHIAEPPSSRCATPTLRSGPTRRLAARGVTAPRRCGFLPSCSCWSKRAVGALSSARARWPNAVGARSGQAR